MSQFRVPTDDLREQLNPTPIDPRESTTLGGTVTDLGKGLEGIGEIVQKMDDRRQTLKAQTYLAQQHRQNYQMAATDPDVDNLEEKINTKSDQDIQAASEMIKSPSARNDFVSKSQLDVERRNVPAYNMILKRKSGELKSALVQANDEDIKTYQQIADPEERKLLKQQVVDRTEQAVADGHINAQWAKLHVDTLLKQADLDQVSNDMAVNAEATYQQLQKGKEGLYPDISEKARKQFMDRAQKQIEKQGSENKIIYGVAQNHAENQLLDAMGKDGLTQEMVNDAQLMGVNGIKIRPEFAKAASEALNDPFPTESNNAKYTKLFDLVTDPDKDPLEVKLDVLKTRGITPQQKAHLLNAALREDPQEGKQSVDQLVQSGIQKNKQAILEGNRKMQKEVENKRSFLGSIGEMFADHAKDDAHLASMQQDFMANIQKAKSNEDMLNQVKTILNRDTLQRNPKISTADPKGTVFQNKLTGEKKIFYPDGHSEPLKNGQ